MSNNDNADATLAISANDAQLQMQQAASGSDAVPAKLVCIDDSQLADDLKGLVVELSNEEVTVGRGEESSLRLVHKKISRHHARVYFVQGAWWVEDRGSTNGVWLNNDVVLRLQVDDNTEPIKELRRLIEKAHERFDWK